MLRSLSICAVASCALVEALSAQTLVRSVNGPAANAQFGKACIVVPDQNSDGYKDLLVGAPGFNGGRGAIYCVSGAFLATGIGAQTLWSLAPSVAAGDNFGFALADVGDVTGDNVHDFLVGQPRYDLSGVNDVGAIRLVNGALRVVVSTIHGDSNAALFGSAVAATGDLNYDGKSEIMIGAPGRGSGAGGIHLLLGASLVLNGSILAQQYGFVSGSNGAELGTSLAAGYANVDSGSQVASPFVVGAPGWNGPAGVDTGKIVFGTLGNGLPSFSGEYVSGVAGERFGASLDAAHDYDGDGKVDVLVGAPNSANGTAYQVGRVVVVSGARLFLQTPPYDLKVFTYGVPPPPVSHSDPAPNFHFGAAVRACPDLNNDGVGEILVGAPDYFSQGFASFNFRGLVRVFSGASSVQLASFTGATTDRLGAGLASTVDDFDGDGFKEFVVAGALADANGVDSGVVKAYRLFPLAPVTYCVGKLNSLGCTPGIGFSSTPSASSSAPALITGTNFINQKSGLLFYSHLPTAVVFQGGTKCVANLTIRTPPQNSGGATSGASCTGAYSIDFNAWITSGLDPSLTAGAEVFAQYWSRDPLSASHTSLSNALRFVIHP